MAVTAKIKCFSCDSTFDYYFFLRKDEEIKCPHCCTQMDEQSAKKVIHAIGEFADTNADLLKYATGLKEPLFQFDLTVNYLGNKKLARMHGFKCSDDSE